MSGESTEPLQSFAGFIARNMGLHFPDDRLPELAQKMSPLAREAGYPDLRSYLLWLMSAPLSQEQMKILAGALTIGETYFLRDPKSYRVLEEELLPALVAARRSSGKTLRIWSAGCSSGEEPYTIAILLSRVLPDLTDWKITLLASDINPQALERGRRGIYSKWSFRNAPAWLMGYFTRQADGSYQVVPLIRDMVRFVHLNLADPQVSASRLTSGMDIIFCRNVMLYFHAAQIEKTIARFSAALSSGGWLFVGPTEVDHQLVDGFTCQQYDGAMVLRKSDPRQKEQRFALSAPESLPHPARKTRGSAVLPPPLSDAKGSSAREPGPSPVSASPAPSDAAPAETATGSWHEAQALYQAGGYEQAALLALALPEGEERSDVMALAARAYANIGRFEEARKYCEKAIALFRLSAQNHYLLSIILEQQGDSDGAVRSLKHALYIDHDYLLAYFALGNLSRQRGELREAEQSFANALRLLQKRDPHEVLPEAEGMTAGRLAQLICDMTGG